MLELRELPADRLPARKDWLVDRLTDRRVRTQYFDPAEARAAATARVEGTAASSQHFDVVEEGREVGLLWWWHEGEEAAVNFVDLAEPARVAELLPTLLGLGRVAGVASVGCAAVPGEPAGAALVALDGFVPRATNMVLPLDEEIGDPGELRLDPMSEEEFAAYMEGAVDQYVAELGATGLSPEAARERGEQQMAELIPDGLSSPGMVFFTARVGDDAVGHLWLSTEHAMAFVYDVEVEEAHRRKGYGAGIMNAGALWSREHGHPALGLNVFAHNPNARALYDKLGYQVTIDFRTIDVAGDAG